MSQGVVRVSLAEIVRDVAADDADKAAAAMKILAEGVFADGRMLRWQLSFCISLLHCINSDADTDGCGGACLLMCH